MFKYNLMKSDEISSIFKLNKNYFNVGDHWDNFLNSFSSKRKPFQYKNLNEKNVLLIKLLMFH